MNRPSPSAPNLKAGAGFYVRATGFVAYYQLSRKRCVALHESQPTTRSSSPCLATSCVVPSYPNLAALV
jgi:hypothetical protein